MGRGRRWEDEDFELDEDDVRQWRCWNCRRTFSVPVGQKARHCPYCGVSLQRGRGLQLGGDPRSVREL